MDYKTLIDEETWAFIRKTDSYFPPDATGLTIPEIREVYNRMCRAFFRGYPPGVRAEDSTANGVPMRVYTAADNPVSVLYLHGGGHVVGGLDSHDEICAEICATTGFGVVSADYRLSPEHRHPAAYDDAVAAARWMLDTRPGPLVLAGDSAGGTLAAAAAHRLRGETRLIGQVLIYPWLGADIDHGSFLAHAHAPMLTREDLIYYRQQHLAKGTSAHDDPTAAPLLDPDFSALPPTVAISAGCDPLADDARDYCEKLRAAGGKAHWIDEPGLVHGYLRARHSVTRARDSFARICAAIAALGAGRWPYDG